MEERIIIGYQGTENSNNHAAALYFAETLVPKKVELRPLVTGKNVARALKCGEIHYGVYAYSTDAAGIVSENEVAFEGTPLAVLNAYTMEIHHHLFKRNATISNSAVTAVASHPEALRECRKNLLTLYSHAKLIPMENTGLAARSLADGSLPETTAVLCSENLGKQFGFVRIQENLEDLEQNRTTFVLVKLSQRDDP